MNEHTAIPAELSNNPLLCESGLPPFADIKPEHVVPAVQYRLEQVNLQFEQLEAAVQPTWEATVEAIDEMGKVFERCWGPVSHLFGVLNSQELREAYESVLSEIVTFGLKVKQSRPFYLALKEMKQGEDWDRFDAAQQRIITEKILNAELAGIGLEDEQQQRFNEIVNELSQLSTQFSNHVLDATKAYSLVIEQSSDVAGMPASALQLAAQSYNQSVDESETGTATADAGPWRFTLDNPSFGPFMQHCKNRELREEMYRAFITRASEGEFDNSLLIDQILKLKQEQAGLLGYQNYAEVSLATKMAADVSAVEEMFSTLRTASWEAAEQDLEDITSLAKESGFSTPLAHWDVPYWSERLREQKYDFSDEELRPYFSLERVLEGLYELLNRLFGVSVRPVTEGVSLWHEDVRYFEILNEQGEQIAGFYLDPYSRPENKRGGAWMDDCLSRRKSPNGRLQLPVAQLVCNSTPPVGEIPSLMTFREVETLFHEFGHGLQHMLTTVDYADASGINGVEWDAVELPSQFMENWCYHKPTLLGMTAHYETGDPLPEELFEKICAARTYRAGTLMLRQLQFGMTDMALHTIDLNQSSETPFEIQQRISAQTSVMPMLPENRFLCSFQHIFSGGYSAGYYSYKWAEVLSADAFGAFEEAGLDDATAVATTGRRFRDTVLALGGSIHPMEIFTKFRGRAPSPQALLKQNGLI